MLTIRTIAQDLAADFAARGIIAAVAFGNWQVAQHTGADRVIIGLGDFDPDGQNQPAGLRPGPVIYNGKAAPSLALHVQEGVAWVHGVAPDGTADADRINASHDRTTVLLHATIAGLIRVVGRGSLSFGKGQWPSVDTGDVTYGALARFRFAVAVPVLGDAYAVVPKPYTVTTTVTGAFPSGDEAGGTFTTEAPP